VVALTNNNCDSTMSYTTTGDPFYVVYDGTDTYPSSSTNYSDNRPRRNRPTLTTNTIILKVPKPQPVLVPKAVLRKRVQAFPQWLPEIRRELIPPQPQNTGRSVWCRPPVGRSQRVHAGRPTFNRYIRSRV